MRQVAEDADVVLLAAVAWEAQEGALLFITEKLQTLSPIWGHAPADVSQCSLYFHTPKQLSCHKALVFQAPNPTWPEPCCGWELLLPTQHSSVTVFSQPQEGKSPKQQDLELLWPRNGQLRYWKTYETPPQN